MLARLVASAVSLGIGVAAHAQQNYWTFPQFDFFEFSFNAMPDDGQAVFGVIESANAFLTPDTLPRRIVLPNAPPRHESVAVSKDGRFVAIRGGSFASPFQSGFRFDTVNLTLTEIPPVSTVGSTVGIRAMSADGVWMYGAVTIPGTGSRGARWSEATGWEFLSDSPSIRTAIACSPSGEWSAGWNSNLTYWRRNPSGVVSSMPDSPSELTDIADNGTCVGRSSNAAAKWGPSGIREPFDIPFPHLRSIATTISADARTIGLEINLAELGLTAYIWRDGMLHRVEDMLASLGYPVENTHFATVSAMSTDGRWISGKAVGTENMWYSANIAGANPPACDSIDFNNDTSLFDTQDVDAFLSVFTEGPCVPIEAACNDLDFNNDGSIFDPCDIDAFILVFSEGPCTLCGN